MTGESNKRKSLEKSYCGFVMNITFHLPPRRIFTPELLAIWGVNHFCSGGFRHLDNLFKDKCQRNLYLEAYEALRDSGELELVSASIDDAFASSKDKETIISEIEEIEESECIDNAELCEARKAGRKTVDHLSDKVSDQTFMATFRRWYEEKTGHALGSQTLSLKYAVGAFLAFFECNQTPEVAEEYYGKVTHFYHLLEEEIDKAELFCLRALQWSVTWLFDGTKDSELSNPDSDLCRRNDEKRRNIFTKMKDAAVAFFNANLVAVTPH